MKRTMRFLTRYTMQSKAITKENFVTTAPRVQQTFSAAPSICIREVPIEHLFVTVTIVINFAN